MRKGLIVIMLLIIVAAGLSFMVFNNGTKSETTANSTNTSMMKDAQVNPPTSPPIVSNQSERPSNDTLFAPDNDSVLRQIQWDKYHLLSNGRVTVNEIAGPNDVIKHSFLSTTVLVDIMDPDNVPELYRELSGLVIDQRKFLGENSGPNVWGFVNGMGCFHAVMIPYNSTVFRYDYYHPVNNLTWSRVDASEID